MNYYRRYVGDYLRDTARLTLLEHGAYTLLLDYYYADEKPLPANRDEIYLLARAMTAQERKAIDKILDLYFTPSEDGWRQSRADEEIDRASEAAEISRRNGKMSHGRPRKETREDTGQDTQQVINDKPSGIPSGIPSGEPDSIPGSKPADNLMRAGDPTTNHQPPSASHHPPETGNTSAEGRKRAGRQPRVTWTEDGGFHVEPKLRAAWEIAYPAINVDQRIAAAHAWLLSNPDNRKSNFSRFLTNWLTKDQDRAPARGGGDKPRERKLAL